MSFISYFFERCLDSNPESRRRKQVRYQLGHPSPCCRKSTLNRALNRFNHF
jgi:hypothetical protein